jgi:hypothetical protein
MTEKKAGGATTKTTPQPAEGSRLRGEALVLAAIEKARSKGTIPDPDPVPAKLLARLLLPNGEPLPASLRALLAFDGAWLGMGIDVEDAELELLDLEDLIAEELGEETAPLFAEACELLSDDCLLVGERAGRARRFLYVGNPDVAGEYPVITVDATGAPWVGGFVPFDVWVAQQLGALPAEATRGEVPAAYAECPAELARSNGDGRVGFCPEPEDAEDA